ncbi:MAG: thioredoxin-dependent thiol peroxidase [Candidatus Dadabacteria bacterium]|nr:MAG: thioredoxin-dependent thiol peroxidase [Candidatus Dadabacteria bacterium]
MVAEGKKAPSFTLPDKDGSKYRLASSEADYTVLFFYPKDNTPGCTIEAKEFSKDINKFKKLNVEVVGVSGGDVDSKVKFAKKHKLKTRLLADKDFKVSQKYGFYGKKSFMGKTFNGIKRSTVILDKNRKVIKVFDRVKPRGHSKEVLEFIRSLTSQ